MRRLLKRMPLVLIVELLVVRRDDRRRVSVTIR
jgi:hypothetical protein